MVLQKKVQDACLLLLLLVLCISSVQAQDLKKEFKKSFKVRVSNPADLQREDVVVFLKEAELRKSNPSFNPEAFVVLANGKEVPSQYNHKDPDKRGVVLVLDKMAPKATQDLIVRYNESGVLKRSYVKRTQAELSHKMGGVFKDRKYIGGAFANVDSLRVPAEHTDHSFYIRYEGPGWESDKVGYRFYLDWRNATDVFGKKTKDMVLQEVGQDGFDSYHNMQPWGMDVLKVGKALGVGTLAMFDGGKAIRVDKTDSVRCRVTENGVVYSSILTDYYGWEVAKQKLDIHALLSIHAGSRLTHYQVKVGGGQPQNLSTGLIKDKKAKLFSNKGDENKWGYLATYGAQSLNDDKLGIAVLFRPKDLIDFDEDELNHVVKLKPVNGELEYYYLAAWELEPEGIKTEEQFIKYLDKTAQELAKPVQVKF